METKRKQKIKMLLVLPLLALPFLALAFYALGGGKSKPSHFIENKGINTSLPNANFKKEEPMDKLSIYNLAEKDTAKNENLEDAAEKLGFHAKEEDLQTQEINQKLNLLNREIANPAKKASTITLAKSMQHEIKNDVDRLETLMKSVQSGKDSDPEMEQLNAVLQNIMDIQHPERIKEKYIRQVTDGADSLFRAFPATVIDNQKVVQGATIKLRLQDSIRLNGVFIPKGQLVYGIGNITNQRLLLDIKTIRLGNLIVPVDLSVYSLDGIKGIYAPDALLTDAINGGADNAIQNLQLMGLDQSMGAQIAGAGIETAKGLFSKKVNRTKVKLKANYQILLRNNKANQPIR